MTNEIKQPYEVLHAIGHKGDRYDKGSIVELTEEEALNIGDEYIKKYFVPIEETASDAEEVSTPESEENTDEKTPESVSENTPENEEEKVEPLSETNPNE